MQRTPVKRWFVYVLLCNDGSLYTGVTTNVQRRFAAHQAKRGAKYTRSHGVKKILFTQRFNGRSKASIRESEIKALTRSQKVQLLNLTVKI